MPLLEETELAGLTRENTFTKFVAIEKVDREQRLVYGTISSEILDDQNQEVDGKAIEEALPDYLKWSNIREMHQPKAAGTAEKIWQEGNLWKICAKVVVNEAWEKVKAGVYKGFSIGGSVKPGGMKRLQKDGVSFQRITALKLVEISLVDRPANPEAVIDMWKMAAVVEPQTPNNNNNEGGAAVMPPELENQTSEAGADQTAADTSTVETTPAAGETQDRVVETPAGNITKSALDAAFAAAEANIER